MDMCPIPIVFSFFNVFNIQEVDPVVDPSPITLDVLFRKRHQHKSAGHCLQEMDVTSHELSLSVCIKVHLLYSILCKYQSPQALDRHIS